MRFYLNEALKTAVLVVLMAGVFSGCSTDSSSQSTTKTTVSGYIDVGGAAKVGN